MADTSGTDVLDEGLSRIARTGPEFGGGLSNHAPMAAEALVRLGRSDAVEHWLDDYLKRLDEPPAASDPVTEQTWRDALGQLRRVADWEVYFSNRIWNGGWLDALACGSSCTWPSPGRVSEPSWSTLPAPRCSRWRWPARRCI